MTFPARRSTSLIALAIALVPGLASAQDRNIQFELGLGTSLAPTYEGSDDYKAGVAMTGSLQALSLGPLQIQPGQLGFGLAPSFRYLSERTKDDAPVLRGIDDVDAALELGLKASYRWEYAEAWGALRKGVTGHEGVVADLGADAIIDAGSNTTLRFGPRVSFADDSYMDTYFSVPTTATRLRAYDADGGLKSYGLEMTMRHDVTEAWAVQGTLGWTQMAGDAADSPIVKAGDRDQGTISLMLIRKFDFRF